MSSTSSVRIAVLGVTGSGKSSLIRAITGCEDIAIGKTLTSETADEKFYRLRFDGDTYDLIDTPGFNDTKRSNEEILDHISEYLSAQSKAGELLSGIIYLHPITEPRLRGTDVLQVNVFNEICGAGTYPNIVFATTFQENQDLSTANTREEELFSNIPLVDDIRAVGGRTARIIHNDQRSSRQLVKSFRKNKAVKLKIQKELEHGSDSSAAAVLTCGEQMQA